MAMFCLGGESGRRDTGGESERGDTKKEEKEIKIVIMMNNHVHSEIIIIMLRHLCLICHQCPVIVLLMKGELGGPLVEGDPEKVDQPSPPSPPC